MRFETDIPLKVKDAYAARHEPEAVRMLARVYWALLITLFVGLVCASLAYGVWEFFRMPKPDEGISGVRPQAAFTRSQLEELLQKFDARADRFQERLTAPVNAQDPS